MLQFGFNNISRTCEYSDTCEKIGGRRRREDRKFGVRNADAFTDPLIGELPVTDSQRGNRFFMDSLIRTRPRVPSGQVSSGPSD